MYDTKKWENLLLQAEKEKQSLLSNNKSLYTKLESLMAEDQTWNNFRINGITDRSTSKQSKDSFERETWKGVQRISAATFDCFKKYGFPSEFDIGPNITNDTSINNFPFFWTIIVHNYQGIAHSDTLFTSVLRQALADGKIKPSLFALLQDFGNINFKRPYYGTSKMYWSVNNKLYVIPFYKDGEHSNTIKLNRSLIGLPTISELEEFLLKMQNSSNKPELQYFIFSAKPTKVALSSSDLENDFIKPMQLVK
ncbi:MAG: hypothetical protein BGO31_02970 [Bacteroidetes bacterium 43-16]|nr:MAG: hypothetical protein BGO31_02970 [Bacteroidetes bacterium 43-16]